MELKNQTILITGGTSGIGLILGRSLLQKGNRVILMGTNPEKLENAKKEGFETLRCDLSKIGEVEQAVLKVQNTYPDLSMLFNNAGLQFNYDYADGVVAPEKIAREVQVNVTGQLILTQLLIPQLANAKRAWIVNTTSGLGAFPKSDGLVYSATKAAMRNFTIGLRHRLRKSTIQVLEFIPPVTDTGMTAGRHGSKMAPEALVKAILPQLERERSILTVRKMRLFLWIAFLFPGLAARILEKA